MFMIYSPVSASSTYNCVLKLHIFTSSVLATNNIKIKIHGVLKCKIYLL